MTTFEITIIVLLAAIVVLLIVLLRTAIEGFRGVWQNQDTMYQDIQRIEVNTHHAFSVLQDNLAPDVETLSNNFQYLLDGKKGVPALFDEVCQTNARIDGFIPMLKKLLEHNESIENFWASDSSLVINLLKEIRNCLTQDINWGELTDEQRSEILYRFTHPVIESPFKPPFTITCETTSEIKED